MKNKNYISMNVFRREKQKYHLIIISLAYTIIALLFLLMCSIYVGIKSFEEYAIIIENTSKFSEENVKLQNEIEYYKLYTEKLMEIIYED